MKKLLLRHKCGLPNANILVPKRQIYWDINWFACFAWITVKWLERMCLFISVYFRVDINSTINWSIATKTFLVLCRRLTVSYSDVAYLTFYLFKSDINMFWDCVGNLREILHFKSFFVILNMPIAKKYNVKTGYLWHFSFRPKTMRWFWIHEYFCMSIGLGIYKIW